jgi:PQ loop repeat
MSESCVCKGSRVRHDRSQLVDQSATDRKGMCTALGLHCTVIHQALCIENVNRNSDIDGPVNAILLMRAAADVQIVASKSVAGLSPMSFYTETIGYILNSMYNIMRGSPLRYPISCCKVLFVLKSVKLFCSATKLQHIQHYHQLCIEVLDMPLVLPIVYCAVCVGALAVFFCEILLSIIFVL